MAMRALTALLLGMVLGVASAAHAQERMCDASAENCRDAKANGKPELLELINNEHQGIDVGVWFFKDDRIVTALVNAWKRGVPMRIIMDPRANASYAANGPELAKLSAAGIPMRKRIAGDICHWKLMIFAGQGVVEWSGANFSPTAFVPQDPYKDYEDEVIYFSEQLVPSFMTMFDNIWTNTKEYANYANVPPTLVRIYPTTPLDPRLNFPPKDSYQDRLIPLIDAEPKTGWIDVDMYRITMARPVDALIRAAARGVRIRMYLEPNEYANVNRPGNKVQMDRLVAAAQQYPGTIEIRMRKHLGINHQKTVWFHAQRVVVFGTSNWSDASDDNQLEANIFTDKVKGDPLNDQLFDDLYAIFDRKWHNSSPILAIETEAWRTTTLPDPQPLTTCQDPKATNVGGALPCTYPPIACTFTLSKTTTPASAQGGPDSVFVTATSSCSSWTATSNASWLKVTAPTTAVTGSRTVTFSVDPNDDPNTASASRTGTLTIAGQTLTVSQAPQGVKTVVLYASRGKITNTTNTQPDPWQVVADPSAAGGSALLNPDRGQAKIPQGTAIATPTNYVEIPFDAFGGVGYHIWVRMKAELNSTSNDSIHMQFNDTVTGSGSTTATMRIGSSSSAEFLLQDGSAGAAPAGWGWTDNGWGVPGNPIYFAGNSSSTHTLRIQQREDGPEIDQIVLSPDTYFTASPGARLNDNTILTETGTTPPCSPSVSPTSVNEPASAGSDSVTVTAAAGCTWTTATTTTPWITITNAGSGNGNGTVSFSVLANSGPQRPGSLSIAGTTVTVTQQAFVPPPSGCTATLSPPSKSFTGSGGTASITVTASACAWSATSNDPWISASGSATGTGTVTFTAAANDPGAPARSGTITIADQTFTVFEDAAAPPTAVGDVILHPSEAPVIFGEWKVSTDPTAAGGASLFNPNSPVSATGAPKIGTASKTPADYFEMTFDAVANTPYRVWLRGKATSDSWANDSVYVQFDGVVASDGVTPLYQIGTVNSLTWSLEDCSGCGVAGWGWQDVGGYGAGISGPLVTFKTSGTQRIRIQVREDGVMLDQIVFSPQQFLSASPGLAKNDNTFVR